MSFDFSKLKNIVQEWLPYELFEDEKTLDESMKPRRNGNEIVTPVFGIFRQNPATLTAVSYPLIAVVGAVIEIACPADRLQEVKDTMDAVAINHNCDTVKVDDYSVTVQMDTCSVGQRRRDVSWDKGEIFAVSSTVTFNVIEGGVPSSADGLKLFIDGHRVPILQFNETRTASSEVIPDSNAVGKVAVTQEVYGVTVSLPIIDNALGDLISEAVSHGGTNRAYAVEVEKNGVRNAYLMTLGTSTTTAQPPLNLGASLSFAEITEDVAKFSDIWHSLIVEGEVFFTMEQMPKRAFVCWGDGTYDFISSASPTVHVYTDGATRHIVRYMDRDDTAKFGKLNSGASLMGKKIRTKSGDYIMSLNLPKESLVIMDSGDTLGVVNNRLCMTVAGVVIPVDLENALIEGGAYVVKDFTATMRGAVIYVAGKFNELFEYDRWAIDGNAQINTASALEIQLQTKSVMPSNETQTVYPDAGYDGLKSVTVWAYAGATEDLDDVLNHQEELIGMLKEVLFSKQI